MTDVHALSGAYAVDALDDGERAEFERHLAECPACQSEVTSLQEAAALLAETTPTTPSASLRAKVLADITTVRPLPPETSTRPVVVELAPRRRRRAATFLAAAAAAVVVGTGGIAWHQMSDDGPQSRISALEHTGDAQHFSTSLGNGGQATIYRSKARNEAAIITSGMPAAPSGKEYVLWLGHGGTMTQAGVMPNGSSNTVFFSGDAASADGAAVSVEDAGTSPTQPSDDVVAAFDFRS